MAKTETEQTILVRDAIFFLSFDIDLVVAAYPGGIRFGKVLCRNSELLFHPNPFHVPQRKFDVFLNILNKISKCLGGNNDDENLNSPSFTYKSYTISTEVCTV